MYEYIYERCIHVLCENDLHKILLYRSPMGSDVIIAQEFLIEAEIRYCSFYISIMKVFFFGTLCVALFVGKLLSARVLSAPVPVLSLIGVPVLCH